jgi:hypothetical protein
MSCAASHEANSRENVYSMFCIYTIFICFVGDVCCMSAEGAEFENFQYQELDISEPGQLI